MAVPCFVSRAIALGAFIRLQPETTYDGKRSVIVSTTQPPECLHGITIETGLVEHSPQDGDFQTSNALRFHYAIENGDKRKKFEFDFVSLDNILSYLESTADREIILKSVWKNLRLLNTDQELSDVKIISYNGDDNKLKLAIKGYGENERTQETDPLNIGIENGGCLSDDPEFFCGIGSGLAFTYYVNHLKPVITGMKDCKHGLSVKELSWTLVVDCSGDIPEVRDRQLKETAWIGSCIFRNGTAERFVKSEVFRLERHETKHIIIDRPAPLRILKYLHSKGKLSVDEFNRETENFRKMLSKIIAKIEAGHKNHQTKCNIYDGKDSNLVDFIWKCSHNVSDSFPENTVDVSSKDEEEDDDDLEVDGTPVTEFPPNVEQNGTEGKASGVFLEDKCSGIEEKLLNLIKMEESDITINHMVYVEEVTNPVTEEAEYGWSLSSALELNIRVREPKDVPLNTEMVVAGLKQENVITIPTVQCLTDDNQQWSSHKRAGLVLQLLLSIMTINIALYSRIVKSLEGLRQRAAASQDKGGGGHEEDSRSRSSSAARETPREESPISKDKKHDSKAPKLTGTEARLQIVSNILFTMIEDKKYFPYDFEVQLRKLVFESKQDISKLRNKDGLSLLHAIVYNNRPQFILPIFRAGCWNDVKALKGDKGLYEGKTADDICTELKYRKVQKEMDNYVIWEKSLNPIHLAARKGDLNEVKKLLKFSEDLHYVNDDNGCTALYWAVVGGSTEIVNLLLQKKVDHEKMNTKKETLLHVACVIGHSHLLTILIKDLKMDLTLKDSTKKSPLLRVAENGDEKSLAKIMKCGLKKEQLGPLLAIAGHYGRLGFIKKVIEEYYVDPGSKDDVGKTAFMRACEQSRIDVAKYLLSKNIVITETDIRRRNVLHMAADGAGIEMMEFLIEEIKKKGDTVLKGMLNQRDKYIGGELCMLIRGKDKGRDSWHYVEVSRGLMDIFMKKTRSGTIDVAKYGTLLHSGWGVDPDEESAKQIEKRFETRRNANMSEDQDMTPLHIAAFKDKPDLAELLMKHGSDLNSRDKFGLTPLHIASMRGNIALVRSMLEKGAMSDVLDNLIKTPVEVAEDNEHKDVAAFIRSLQYIPMAQNFRETILPIFSNLISAEYIRRLQETGGDVRTHLINTLRDLTIDINETLLALGSGPVLEESTSSDPHTKH